MARVGFPRTTVRSTSSGRNQVEEEGQKSRSGTGTDEASGDRHLPPPPRVRGRRWTLPPMRGVRWPSSLGNKAPREGAICEGVLLLLTMASLCLGSGECAASESNEILSSGETIAPGYRMHSEEAASLGPTGRPSQEPPLLPPSTPPPRPLPSLPSVISNAAEARRHDATSRDEGSRRQRPGDIRCYCNVPRCVSTGYMCKSSSGACFSDIADRSDVELATHGCIELLPSWRRGECRSGGKSSQQPNTRPLITANLHNSMPCLHKKCPKGEATTTGPLLAPDASNKHKGRIVVLCCHSDLCNHIDSPEIRLRLTNDSLFAGSPSGVTQQGSSVDGGESAGNPALYFGNSQDGWFRIATIAVPICGAVILMLLIFVAFKILRPKSEDQKLQHGQRSKQCHSGGTQEWGEDGQRHHSSEARGHLLSSEIACSEDLCHKGGFSKSSSRALNSMDAKGHLLPQRMHVGSSSTQKKSTKLDFLFLFSRTGKSEKIEVSKLKQLPTSVCATKADEVPVAVSLQSGQEQI